MYLFLFRVLTGCAYYEPVIDKNTNLSNYNRDLMECQNKANDADAEKVLLMILLIVIIVAAAVAAGGSGGFGPTFGSSSGNDERHQKEKINQCLQDRGYRVLH